jgi:hypothetical protein
MMTSCLRLFCHGQLVGEIIPELWMTDQAAHLQWYGEEGASRRVDGSNAKSATNLSREVRVTSTDIRNETMTALQEFRCGVCGIVTSNPIHWFVLRYGDSELTVHRWNSEAKRLEHGTTG